MVISTRFNIVALCKCHGKAHHYNISVRIKYLLKICDLETFSFIKDACLGCPSLCQYDVLIR